MHPFRRHAVGLAAISAIVQLCVFAFTTSMLAACCAKASSPKVMACCKVESGHMCGLMRKGPARSSNSMKSCGGADERLLANLFGARGEIVSLGALALPQLAGDADALVTHELTRGAPADLPPPRA